MAQTEQIQEAETRPTHPPPLLHHPGKLNQLTICIWNLFLPLILRYFYFRQYKISLIFTSYTLY